MCPKSVIREKEHVSGSTVIVIWPGKKKEKYETSGEKRRQHNLEGGILNTQK